MLRSLAALASALVLRAWAGALMSQSIHVLPSSLTEPPSRRLESAYGTAAPPGMAVGAAGPTTGGWRAPPACPGGDRLVAADRRCHQVRDPRPGDRAHTVCPHLHRWLRGVRPRAIRCHVADPSRPGDLLRVRPGPPRRR